MLTKTFVEKHKPVFKAVFKKFSKKRQQFIWNVTFGIADRLVEFKWRAGTAWIMWEFPHLHKVAPIFRLTKWGANPTEPETKLWGKGGAIPKPPSIGNILSCLSSDILAGRLSFEQFADEMGYNTDSRNDYKLWKKCRNFAAKCSFTFPPEFVHDLTEASDWE